MATQQTYHPLTYQQKTADLSDIWKKYWTIVDRQKAYEVGWWFISLLLHGCILVPLTFLAVYTLNGPTSTFLVISLLSFFTNFIGYMGGASFRFNFTSFVLSIVIHVLMILFALLLNV
jgi:hypothetical protein